MTNSETQVAEVSMPCVENNVETESGIYHAGELIEFHELAIYTAEWRKVCVVLKTFNIIDFQGMTCLQIYNILKEGGFIKWVTLRRLCSDGKSPAEECDIDVGDTQLVVSRYRNSNLVAFAREELERKYPKCEDSSENELQELMKNSILDCVGSFIGHSGFSAPFAIDSIHRLLQFRPLTSLTGEDSEWIEVGENLWQNKRSSNIFKDNKSAYVVDHFIFKDDAGAFTGRYSRKNIDFPYTVEEPVQVNIKDFAFTVGEVEFQKRFYVDAPQEFKDSYPELLPVCVSEEQAVKLTDPVYLVKFMEDKIND